MSVDIHQVREFWEENPLWTGESPYQPGSYEFFEEHRRTYIDDCFAGSFDIRFYPPPGLMARLCTSSIWGVESVSGLWSLPCVA